MGHSPDYLICRPSVKARISQLRSLRCIVSTGVSSRSTISFHFAFFHARLWVMSHNWQRAVPRIFP
jgi:hypothetical protein